MALIRSKEYGKKISNLSVNCPNCGFPTFHTLVEDTETEELLNKLSLAEIEKVKEKMKKIKTKYVEKI